MVCMENMGTFAAVVTLPIISNKTVLVELPCIMQA